jgi:hypothetical protein
MSSHPSSADCVHGAYAAPPREWGGAVFVLEDIIVNTIIATKDRYIVDVSVPLREHAVRCALAYFMAFMFAFLDHIERVTGRRDYDDYSGLVQPDDPVLQALWRAKSTSEQARKLAADTDLMRDLARNPHLVSLAEDCAERLLPAEQESAP